MRWWECWAMVHSAVVIIAFVLFAIGWVLHAEAQCRLVKLLS